MRSDRRLRVVLDTAAYLAGAFDTDEPGDQVQGHVDAADTPAEAMNVSVVDVAVLGPDLDARVGGGQLVEGRPVRRGGRPASRPAAA